MAVLRWFRDTFLWGLNTFFRFLVLLITVIVVLAVIGMLSQKGVQPNTVLTLDLRGELPDKAPNDPFAAFSGEQPLGLIDVVRVLAKAETDENVKGIVLRLGTGTGVAEAQELREALRRFKDKGKFVIAAANAFYSAGLGDYYVAALADEIWLQPVSQIGTAGLGGATPFFRNLLDKISARPQLGQRYEYKNAANTFTQTDFTPAHRAAMERLLQSSYDTAVDEFAADRKIAPAQMRALLDDAPHLSDAALKAGLVTNLGFDDDAMKSAQARAGAEDAPLVNLREYAELAGGKAFAAAPGATPIAFIHGSGTIVDGNGGGDPFGGEESIAGDPFARAFREAAKDEAVKVILFRVDSPGGSATASDQILDAARKAQAAGKKLVVSMGPVAASGGYWVSMYADQIYALPSTITGSIGVLSGKIVLNETFGLIGVDFREIAVGRNTMIDSEFSPYSPEGEAKLNASLDQIYEAFTAKVAEGRGMPVDKVRAEGDAVVARGRVWTGVDAKERGLVDELGGFRAALDKARALAEIAPDAPVELRQYPAPKGFFEEFAAAMGGAAAVVRVARGLEVVMGDENAQALFRALATADRPGVQAIEQSVPEH